MISEFDREKLKHQIQANKHEVYVVSLEEMDAIVNSSPKGRFPHINNAWQKLKSKAETGATYYASADDLRTMSKLIGDLGGFASKAYIKTYGGKPHIILKGHAGLRTILTGTRYGIKNPKVITMGLGKVGAINAARSGGILSVILLSAYRIADYVLTDQATLNQLIGSLATDVVKIGIATGASIVAASAITAAGFTIAVGPILAVVVVGIAVSWALGTIDQHYGITEKVILGLDELEENIQSRMNNIRKEIENTIDNVVSAAIDYAVDSARRLVIETARHQLDKFLSSRAGIF